ncbi:MAG: polysaccharide pyruvyl transferase family protein [Oscillospiraceae bacterium]|nr:polysaccharide pyruvyl transferase family protein [Oscillospiraceae bacterium]
MAKNVEVIEKKSKLRSFLLRVYRKICRILDRKPKVDILLLTNRDSDNVGDQVIEACDISLIAAIMKNLNIKKKGYKIRSRAASFIKNENDAVIRKTIKETDVILFGGAPLFNYDHQSFYANTAKTIKFAQEQNKPVVFSAIGIEGYSDKNKKCQILKEALNLPCVKQITTRDDVDSLKKYNSTVPTGLVSDPAVFSSTVFKRIASTHKSGTKRIGLFAARKGLCLDNRISFDAKSQMNLWEETVAVLEEKGYDYRFITTGHFSDESFMVHMSDSGKFKNEKFVFNMNTPEDLIKEIARCDAIIAFRLHANIIAYSYDIPAVGLIWNPKIPFFYERIEYPERAVNVVGCNGELLVAALEDAIENGVKKSPGYLMSVYGTLFKAFKEIFPADKKTEPYSYEALLKKIPEFAGTPRREKKAKLRRKFLRTYRSYNKLQNKLEEVAL